ncbi:methylmalonyl-CoA mutase family protein [Persicobacter psychrovividus]|uniref:Fused isobutyryl-CoA mutase n=1 Tax=Persicobacter psychrovividus TaxID=387638 RepID=A0ABN6LF17_9BACT|nr:Fused isobutyryl-CoA mutase [Persicobacter psychrovividus]
MKAEKPYQPKNFVRIVTAASLFDGHDAAINIMRRLMQHAGVEVIHLGHNRSVNEIVDCAIQEDAQAIAITSYQGGHLEFFKYMYDLLSEKGAADILIFGGGGGTILPDEITELHQYGIKKIYSPDDGRKMGLQGMINDLVRKADFPRGENEISVHDLSAKNPYLVAKAISAVENEISVHDLSLKELYKQAESTNIPVLGITGTGGAGKSTVTDELIRRLIRDYPDKMIGIISVDPSRRRTGGALLGDRIRMNCIHNEQVYLRSMATRAENVALSGHIRDAVNILKVAAYDFIILESSGIGQSSSEMVDIADHTVYVMTPEYGAASQLEKIDMLDFADFIVLNKADKRGAEDALRDLRKQYRRNHQDWETPDEQLPVFMTVASHFNGQGVEHTYQQIVHKLSQNYHRTYSVSEEGSIKRRNEIIPPARVRYLSEIAEVIRNYNTKVARDSETAQQVQALEMTKEMLPDLSTIETKIAELRQKMDHENWAELSTWEALAEEYSREEVEYQVRNKKIKVSNYTLSLSGTKLPKVLMPTYQGFGDRLRWLRQENLPGRFPYTAGVFPFKREGEDPTRMFAGEGGPERTNRRFHYVSAGLPAKRLSTAFDSVTLYGSDPAERPDIYGKVGNSGVSVCCLDDAKKLYAGFDLSDPKTSVSMTINGPAAVITAFFMNAAIDQNCEKYIHQHGLELEVRQKMDDIFKRRGQKKPTYQGPLPSGNDGLGTFLLGVSGSDVLPEEIYRQIRDETLSQVRGTVQADILKEDQAQNTCIFSTDFSLRLMGDMQLYFTAHQINNFYSVSISGYHIAEAGANPITQLAFTLANGFTYVEYYLARGLKVDDFVPNLSFFFSNGIDPEYAVIGRVARRIWAKAMKYKYHANSRAQKLKYHIQTSGRSLHAQDIAFNDIRTTLQALYAIYDNCNSLHTNAYDEAITTPTEESVRRAMAIQLVINKELGLAKNENPLQGAFIIEALTDLVEEAVLAEFDRLTDRGGVLGAMETMYQRSKIQEESMHYEQKKADGSLPLIGVNTFLSSTGSPIETPGEVIRATADEKRYQINMLNDFQKAMSGESEQQLERLKAAAIAGENMFNQLMETVKFCSLGQITAALYEVGGQYRRNM